MSHEAPTAPVSLWTRTPVTLRALLSGTAIMLLGVNVWGLLIVTLGIKTAVLVTPFWLGAFALWTSGWGPPARTRPARRTAFRSPSLALPVTSIAFALAFVGAVECAIVLVFRVTPFPREAFRAAYAGLPINSAPWAWAAIGVASLTAGLCEEVGFRGFMQRPIEQRHGPTVAIAITAAAFLAVHLAQSWAVPAMLPIILGAGALLGVMAWSTRSLLPGIIGHTLMDIWNFSYWWTGLVGDFTARPVAETGLDAGFFAASAGLCASMIVLVLATGRFVSSRGGGA